MTTKHTPGPWDFEFGEMGGYDCMTDAFKVTAGQRLIAELDLSGYGQSTRQREGTGDKAEAEANARLIAAAPDLLEELKNIANANPKEWEPEVRDQFQAWAQNRARAAIQKAEETR